MPTNFQCVLYTSIVEDLRKPVTIFIWSKQAKLVVYVETYDINTIAELTVFEENCSVTMNGYVTGSIEDNRFNFAVKMERGLDKTIYRFQHIPTCIFFTKRTQLSMDQSNNNILDICDKGVDTTSLNDDLEALNAVIERIDAKRIDWFSCQI